MSQKPDISDLTICRAVFAAWVFIYHVDLHLNVSVWLGPFAGLIRHGYMGVDGFFILSGLVLTYQHRELDVPKAGTLKPEFKLAEWGVILRFYGKRLARLYPVHVAVLLILAALAMAGMAAGIAPHAPQRFGLGALAQNLLLVQGWGGDHFGAWNYPSWSVSTEWAGYLLFPLLAVLLSYFQPVVSLQLAIAAIPVLGVVYFCYGNTLNLTFSAGLIRFFPEFIAGMAMFRMAPAAADHEGVRKLFLWAGLGVVFIGAVTGMGVAIVVGLWGVLFAFYMQADAEQPPIMGQRPVLHFLGLLSYCFYMSFATAELATMQAFDHFGLKPADEKLLFAAAMTLLSFVLAILLRGFVEQPCRRAAERWLALKSEAALPRAATEKPQSLF